MPFRTFALCPVFFALSCAKRLKFFSNLRVLLITAETQRTQRYPTECEPQRHKDTKKLRKQRRNSWYKRNVQTLVCTGELNGADPVAEARWFVEQQSQELSVCLSQLQQPRQSEPQSWFSGGLQFGVSTPNLSELIRGIQSGVHQGVQSAPVRKATTSKNKPEPDSLVAVSNGCSVHST